MLWIASAATLDALGLRFLATCALRIYQNVSGQLNEISEAGHPPEAADQRPQLLAAHVGASLPSESKAGAYTFADYAYDLKDDEFMHSPHSATTWMLAQIVQVSQQHLTPDDRARQQAILQRLETDTLHVKKTRDQLAAAKQQLEASILADTTRRLNMDRPASMPSSGAAETDSNVPVQDLQASQQTDQLFHLDAVTGQTITVDVDTRTELLRLLLNSSSPSNNVLPFLKQRHIPDEVIQKLCDGQAQLPVEQLLAMDEHRLLLRGLLPPQRSQVLDLIEHVNARLGDCMVAQTKARYTLERKLAKDRRSLEATADQLRSQQARLDKLHERCLTIQSLLHPTKSEQLVSPADFPATLGPGPARLPSDHSPYGCHRFSISASTFANLRSFGYEWLQERRRKRAARISRKQAELEDRLHQHHPQRRQQHHGFSSADESGMSEVEKQINYLIVNEGVTQDPTTATSSPLTPLSSMTNLTSEPVQSLKPICLAVMAIVLRYVLGTDRFSLGHTAHFRRATCKRAQHLMEPVIGPLSATHPLQMDLSKPGLSFHSLYGNIVKQLSRADRYASKILVDDCIHKSDLDSVHSIQQKFRMNVIFEYFNQTEASAWTSRTLALGVDDLLGSVVGDQSATPSQPPPQASKTTSAASAPHCAPIQPLWMDDGAEHSVKVTIVEDPVSQNGLQVSFQYRRDRYEASQIAKWSETFATILSNIEYGGRSVKVAALIARLYHSAFQSTA